MSFVTRFATNNPVTGISGVYPSGTGAVNASINSSNSGAWFSYNDQIKIPAGKWLVKIIGVPNAAARFYTSSSTWIDYTGTLETIITTNGEDLQRFWAASAEAVAGKEVNTIFTRITPPTQ